MNNQIVFFGATQSPPPHGNWHRITGVDGGEVAYCMFGDDRIDAPASEVEAVTSQVWKKLETSAGLMLTVLPTEPNSKVRVRSKESKTVSAPSRAMRLTLNGLHKWEKLKHDEEFELLPWECLIVPVTSGLEKKLSTFVESLEGLPDDYRASMVFNLVLPTFEARIGRLEQFEAARKSLPQSPPRAPREQYGPQPLGLWESVMITVVIVVGASVGWFLLHRELSDLTDAVVTIQTEIGDMKNGPTNKNAAESGDDQNSSGGARNGRKSESGGSNPKRRSGDDETDKGANRPILRPEVRPPAGR